MSFMDDMAAKAKSKAQEWDVEGKAEKFTSEVDRIAHEARDRAAQYAHENRDRVRETLDKAGAKIDERTAGRYSDKISRAKESLNKGGA